LRREGQVVTADASTDAADLGGTLSPEQHDASRRFRDDWQAPSRAAFDRASQALLRETDVYVHNRVVVACIRGERPEVMAKRLGSVAGTPEPAALAGIVGQLKSGLDALGRHYAGEAVQDLA
jgi:hypothetical protein